MTGDELKQKANEKLDETRKKLNETGDELKEKTNEKIDETKRKLDEIKESITNFKNAHLSKEAREEELEKIGEKIQDANEEIKERADILKDNVTSQFQTVIDSLKNEYNLLLSVGDKTPGDSSPSSTDTPSTDEEKGFFGRTTDWVAEQWNAMTMDNLKKEPGKTVLRGLGFAATGVGLGVLVYKGCKKLFGKEAREARKERRRQKREARKEAKAKSKAEEAQLSFWDRPFGKFVKGTAIGAAVVGLLYGIKKGINKGKEGSDATDSAGSQAADTIKEKEKDPEKFTKHKEIGENVDNQYNEIMKKELDAGWGGMSIADGYEKYADKHNVDKDTFQATVPMCMDNQFNDVAHLLSEGSYYAYLRTLKFNELKNEILSWGKEKIGKIIGPFLTNLTSYIPFKGKDRAEGLASWFESGEPLEREKEIQLFFRQYAKVLAYTQDKLLSLKEKIAEEKISYTEGHHSTISDALDDEERVEKYVYSDGRYRNFINGKLHQSVDVMKQVGIFNSELSHDMDKIKAGCDGERDSMLNFKDGKDALQRLDDAGANLTRENYKEGIECCDKITQDINDEFEKTMTYLYFGSVHEAINSKENNIQEFLEHSGLNRLKAELIVSMNEYKQKFASGNITQEEIALYKNQVNSYFAMKKEVLIGANAIKQMKSDNPDRWARTLNIGKAALGDILHQTGASIKHFKNKEYFDGWVAATLPLYLGGGVLKLVGKSAGIDYIAGLGNWIQERNIVSTAARVGTRRVPYKSLDNMPEYLLKIRYNTRNGDQLLLQDLLEGKICGDKATRVIQRGNKDWVHLEGKKASSISDFVQKMMGKDAASMSGANIDILFNNTGDIAFMRNPKLREMFFDGPSITSADRARSVRDGCLRKTYKPIGFPNKIGALQEFMVGVGGKNSIYETLTVKQQSFAKQLLETGDFKRIEDVEVFVHNVKNYKLEGLNEAQISRLVEELGKNTDELGDLAKIESKINDIVLKSNPKIQKIVEELDLEKGKIRARGESIASKNQLDNIDEFKKALSSMDDIELERTAALLGEFKKGGTLGDAISQLSVLRKLEGKIIDTVDSAGKPITKNLDDIIKNMEADELLKCKGKISGVTDDAIESLAKIFENIKANKILKFSNNIDEIGKTLKVLFKLVAKAT